MRADASRCEQMRADEHATPRQCPPPGPPGPPGPHLTLGRLINSHTAKVLLWLSHIPIIVGDGELSKPFRGNFLGEQASKSMQLL